MPAEVRPFRRHDREQLTALVDAHVAAVVPGVSVSVNTVLAHLERQPAEHVVDPWVEERVTLVAAERSRVVAAAHLLRYGTAERVGDSYRDAGEIRWLLFWPDSRDAGERLLAGCLAQLEAWAVSRRYADGTLPAPGVYGVPEQWPHVRAAYDGAGFVHDGHTEIVFLARLDDLSAPGPPALPGLRLSRSVGVNGTRLGAGAGEELIGFVEVEVLETAARFPRQPGLADVGNLWVGEAHRRRGVATWLLAQAADWLRLASVDRVLAYSWETDRACVAFLRGAGFRELTRTARGWVLR